MATKKSQKEVSSKVSITVKADVLKEMVARAVKGASNNKLIEITSYMCVQLHNNQLCLITNDATNYLYIRQDGVQGDDFYVVVKVDMFAKLVSRMTCENITLTLDSKMQTLEVKGNGTYRIELQVDENGNLIQYPDPMQEFQESADTNTINLSTVKVILNSIKPALAVTLEIPCYTGYYAGERVVATDTYKIAAMDVKLLEQPKLISPEMMNLLAVMTEEKINVDIKDEVIVFSTKDCVIYGREMEGIEDYSIQDIGNLIDAEMESCVTLQKSAVLQLLDRLCLFVSAYDKNGIYLTFTGDGLQVTSKASSGVEVIPYINGEDFHEFSCLIDIEMLTQEVKAITSDVIELHYGDGNAIKMVDGNITIVVALLEEDAQ